MTIACPNIIIIMYNIIIIYTFVKRIVINLEEEENKSVGKYG